MKSGMVVAGVLAVAGTGASAYAVANGDVVFTNFNNNSVQLIGDPGGANTLSNLVNYGGAFGGATHRLGGITQAGNGKFYVGNGPADAGDPNWTASNVLEITDLFGTPSTAVFANSAQGVQNPGDIVWNQANDNLLWVQNPFKWTGPGQVVNDGIYGAPVNTGVVSQFFQETASGLRPFYEAGVYMTKDPNSSDYFVTSLNGGVGGGAGDNAASVLWRFSPNFVNPALSTLSVLHDFTGLTDATTQVQIRGVAAVPGTSDIYVTNNIDGTLFGFNGAPAGVYKITLDGSGNFLSKTLVNGNILQPEAIEWNPYTNKLVISSFNDVNNNGFSEEGIIYEMNLDGTGLAPIATGVFARDFYIVPTPGTLALVGLGGLAVIRRRRA